MNKQRSNNRKTPEQIDAAIRQLVSKAITTEGQVIDVFTAAGLPKPDISILSDQFLAEVRGLKHKNVAAELLEKLLKDELKVRSRRGQDLGLTDDEVAFYDALAANESAVIAVELITQVRKSVTIDWTLRESARARIRVMVKRLLNKYGYLPDLQDEAVKTVLALKAYENLALSHCPSDTTTSATPPASKPSSMLSSKPKTGCSRLPATKLSCSMPCPTSCQPCARMPPPTRNMASVPSTVRLFISRGAASSKPRPSFCCKACATLLVR